MSPRRAPRTSKGKRTPYRPPRDRRELWTAIAVAVLIVVVTASLLWFLRPNRESASTDTSPLTVPTATAPTTDTTATTGTTDTTAPTTPAEDTTAPASGG